MASLVDRIDKLGAAKSANKASYSDALFGYGGAYIPSGDLGRDDWGAAAAYAVIVEVYAAMKVWTTFLDGVTWIVKDKSTGTEIARTGKQGYPLEECGGKWYKAIKDHERRYHHSYFKSLAFSDWLYGNSYIAMLGAETSYRPERPTYQNFVGMKWLNPLNTTPIIMSGKIDYYQYTGLDADGHYQIAPSAMAYRINSRNAFNDLLGYSGVLAAMDSINLSRNAVKAFKNFFSNGMILGGTIMPRGENKLGDREHGIVTRELASNHKGTANSNRWLVLPQALDVTPFSQENASQNFTVTKELKNTIFTALSVPPQLAGDPSDATYDNAEDIKRQWYQTFFIPYVKDIADFNSDDVIRKLEPDAGVYIEPDLSPYEVEPPDVISQDVTAGYISITTAQAKRGYAVSEKLSGVYLINGVPMHEDMIAELSRRVPSQYALDYAQAQAASQAPNTNADAASGTVQPIEAPVTDTSEITSHYLSSDTETKSHDHSHDLPAIIESPNVSELEELAAWRKFVTNGKSQKRSFEPVALRGDIGDALQSAVDTHDKQTILDAFKAAFDKLSVKAIQATRLDYERDFDELLSRARSERMQRTQWASAMRVIGRRYGTKAYVDGMTDGGVEDDLSDDDRITINDLVAAQSPYVTELGNVLFKEDGISDAQADGKAAMWWNKSLQPLYQAGLESAAINSIFEWVYGDTEHCEDCKRLNGQRHRLKGWKANYLPQDDRIACLGFNCKCKLVKVKGRQRGNY